MNDSPAVTFSDVPEPPLDVELAPQREPAKQAAATVVEFDAPDLQPEFSPPPPFQPAHAAGQAPGERRDLPPDDVGEQIDATESHTVDALDATVDRNTVSGPAVRDQPTSPTDATVTPRPVERPEPVDARPDEVSRHDAQPEAVDESVPETRPVPLQAAAPSAPSQRAEPAVVGIEQVTPAQPLDNPLPDYPLAAVQNRWEGRLTLEVEISAEGKVVNVVVRRGSGYAQLDESALTAVRRWRFRPARRGDKAVATTVLLPIRFRLD
ncbi:MAG: TonB family protein [Pirellulales bacterium]